MKNRYPVLTLLAGALLFWTACGGGSTGTSNSATPSFSTPPAITTDATLPSALQGHSYSTTLTATGGSGALHWTIAHVSPSTLFPDGLQINADRGVISGTANFSGTAGFLATVSDSASPPHSASKNFTVTAYQPLTAAATQPDREIAQFQPVVASVNVSGGVPPLQFKLSSGALPPGIKLNAQSGMFTGIPSTMGTYQFSVAIQDSFSTPETASTSLSWTVVPPPLTLAGSFPFHIPVNVPFQGMVVANGGTPPYTFSTSTTSLPPDLTLDSSTGQVTGTPTRLGRFTFEVAVTDATATRARVTFGVSIEPKLGRNDTIQTATLMGNGIFSASISPYIDPPAAGVRPGDNDYYKLRAATGSIVHVETIAKRNSDGIPTDTVLEIVDANGVRLNSCRPPGDTSTNFSSPCLNDDISSSPHVQDSALDFQVPANLTEFYAHVLDWRGDARPDMTYAISVSGAVDPLKIFPIEPLPGATNGFVYNQQLFAQGGTSPYVWSVTSGSLPPGFSLASSSGAITGTSTTNGSYAFTIQVADSGNPAQTASRDYTIGVGDPVKIASSATLPDACVNQPYFFTLQTSAGVPPFTWFFSPASWPAINLDIYTGTFSGTATTTGTFTGALAITDSAGSRDNQSVSLTVKTCP